MLDLIFLNLRYIGYAAVLLGIVWLANFLLDLYYNIAIVHKCWNCRTFYDGVLRFGAVCLGVTLLTVAISTFPQFLSSIGLTVPEEYVDAMSVLAIVTLFAKGIYEYTIRAMDKHNSILKSELADMDQDIEKRG